MCYLLRFLKEPKTMEETVAKCKSLFKISLDEAKKIIEQLVNIHVLFYLKGKLYSNAAYITSSSASLK